MLWPWPIAYTGHSKNQRNRAASPHRQVGVEAGPPVQLCHHSTTATTRYTTPTRSSWLTPPAPARATARSGGAAASPTIGLTGSCGDGVAVGSVTTTDRPRWSGTGGQ